MNKAIEWNKMTVMIKRLLSEFSWYWKFMCTDKNNDKNKTKPLSSSTPFTVFLIAEKLLNLWLWNFQTFSLFLLTGLWKIKCNCMSGLFCIANLLEVDWKKAFF